MPVAQALVHLGPDDLTAAMAADVRAGLTATPKTLPPKYFYDARGSDLFDQITRLPEYYPTRTETAILRAHGADIAALTRAETLTELGSGTSEKTRLLLRALADAGSLRRFVPLDVDATVLSRAGASIADAFPGIQVEPVVGDFERHLDKLPRHPHRLLVFLGSTIGNLEPPARTRFLATVRASLSSGDAFLLGVDLVKDTRRLVSAYDDQQGVTATFNKNILAVLDRELDADFDLDAFDHRTIWNHRAEWIEMHLVSRTDHVVHIPTLDLRVSFDAGETLRTEISAKFRRDGIEAELAEAGLRATHWWTDPMGDFGLSLSSPS